MNLRFKACLISSRDNMGYGEREETRETMTEFEDRSLQLYLIIFNSKNPFILVRC